MPVSYIKEGKMEKEHSPVIKSTYSLVDDTIKFSFQHSHAYNLRS